MSFFQRSMAAAPTVLFAIAVLLLVLSLIGSFALDFGDTYTESGSVGIQLAVALSTGLQAAFWPFFGAAVLWRLDRKAGAS